MLTVDQLKEFGANVDEGLARCMGKEDFYLRLVNMALQDQGFEKLKTSLEAGDLDTAFEAAHALKGILGNLSLTPLFEPASEITELLRSRSEIDYTPLLTKILEEKDRLAALAGN